MLIRSFLGNDRYIYRKGSCGGGQKKIKLLLVGMCVCVLIDKVMVNMLGKTHTYRNG